VAAPSADALRPTKGASKGATGGLPSLEGRGGGGGASRGEQDMKGAGRAGGAVAAMQYGGARRNATRASSAW